MLEFKTERVADDSDVMESPTRPPVDLNAFVGQSINAMSSRRLKAFERKAEKIMRDAEARASTAGAARGSCK